MNRRVFLSAIIMISFVWGEAIAGSEAKLSFLTYPGTGKADIKVNEFMDGIGGLRKEIERVSGRSLYVTMVRRIQDYEAPLKDKLLLPMLVYGPVTSAAKYLDAGYVPLVRVEKPANGMVVSKKPLDVIQGVVCPDPMSWLTTVGTYALRARLKREIQFYFTSTQDAAAWSLRTGLADATIVRPGTFKKMKERDAAFQVVMTLPETPDFTLLAHPSMEPGVQAAIRNALVALPDKAIEALDKVYHVQTTRFVHALPKEYDEVRRIVAAARPDEH